MYKNFTNNKIGKRRSYAYKILLIMRLTTVILFASLLQVSAATFGQKVTLKQNAISLKEVFKELEKQTGFTVIYFDNYIDDKKNVDVNFSQASLDQVMNNVLSGLPFNFVIKDKAVILTEKPKTIINRIMDVFSNIDVHGRVVDENGNGLSGAVIKIKDGKKTAISDINGYFIFPSVDENALLTISYLGFQVQEIKAKKDLGEIKMQEISGQLSEVGIVSTGFQTIPKDRATGSFALVDNALLNRSVSTNILDRLKGVTSGLSFNDNGNHQFGQSNIEVRGRATLFSNPNPLIVIDNFPYDGDLNNINPNDIENITVLKDAAAASAWGSRSGNGVIVITTKKGSLNAAPTISLNANINIGSKPDLYYLPQLSSSEYIDVEQFMYNKGAYNNTINNGYTGLSPAVDVFLASKNGLSKADSLLRINNLKNYDIRDQLSKYFYRPTVNQQYQANISGGSLNQKYFISAGFDKNLNQTKNNDYGRVTINASNTYYFLKNKLELFTNIIYTSSKSTLGQDITNQSSSYPYMQIADANGNPARVINGNLLRQSFTNSIGNGKLLSWDYKPLDEVNNNYSALRNTLTDYRINVSLSYKIIRGLKAAVLYNYERGMSDNNRLNELQSFYTRDQVNSLTQINTVSGLLTYPIPLGGILTDATTNLRSHNGRFQLNYDSSFGRNVINAIAGSEIKDYSSFSNSNTLYGYNPENASNQNSSINYTADNPLIYGFNTQRILNGSQQLGNTNRFFSYYFNGSYTYNNKYIVSLSARRDESNLFGVSANQKGVPLWSTGLSWVIAKEDFYGLSWLPVLKIRATYGYTGNVNNSISAYLTATRGISLQRYNTPYTEIVNPPNSSLRWEKNRNINLGIDFVTMSSRVSGSIDIWKKSGLDLIGNSPIAPQTGISIYTGNSANTITNGVDLQINSINLTGVVKWNTTLLYNYNSSKVTDYKVSNGSNYNVVSSNYNNPLQGYPYYSIFSFKYAGLDHNGNPRGYLDNQITEDYTGISNSTNRAELIFNGSATPTSFGYLRNTFSYRNLNLSVNIGYKFGYFFRRTSFNNSSLLTGIYQIPDYNNRWQKTGDELNTNVPSLIYPANSNRDNLYTFSDFLVQKGDNIKLQDLQLGYTLLKKKWMPIKSLNVFTYVNNIGILWRANKFKIDPDYPTSYPAIRTVAFGIKADL